MLAYDVFVKDAQYLKNFKVLVSELGYIQDHLFQQSKTCVEIDDPGSIPTRSLKPLKCQSPIPGKYVIILSTTGPMSLAEVEIYAQ